MKIQWSRKARRDVLGIGRYIARRNPEAARSMVFELRTRVQGIVSFPLSGRVVPEIAREDVREVIERNYRIVYLVKEDAIEIVRVFEAHKLFPLKDFEEKQE